MQYTLSAAEGSGLILQTSTWMCNIYSPNVIKAKYYVPQWLLVFANSCCTQVALSRRSLRLRLSVNGEKYCSCCFWLFHAVVLLWSRGCGICCGTACPDHNEVRAWEDQTGFCLSREDEPQPHDCWWVKTCFINNPSFSCNTGVCKGCCGCFLSLGNL